MGGRHAPALGSVCAHAACLSLPLGWLSILFGVSLLMESSRFPRWVRFHCAPNSSRWFCSAMREATLKNWCLFFQIDRVTLFLWKSCFLLFFFVLRLLEPLYYILLISPDSLEGNEEIRSGRIILLCPEIKSLRGLGGGCLSPSTVDQTQGPIEAACEGPGGRGWNAVN